MDVNRLAWSPSQRRAVMLLIGALVIFLAARLTRHRLYLPDPLPAAGPRASELADRIDPNTADWPTLAALPMLGPSRAKQIVAYRDEQLAARHASGPVFRKPDDLLAVKGIGVAIAQALEPYLIFPTTQPAATKPADPTADLR